MRGIDKSFGYNAASTEADRVSERELLWSLVDIVAKNGNLLLNVGPRGVDAQIPAEQITRLDWLGTFLAAHEPALRAARPWVVPNGAPGGAVDVRYTARDRDVFAILRSATGRPAERAALADIESTATTTVHALGGTALAWRSTGDGIEVDLAPPLAGDRPVAIAIRDAGPRPDRTPSGTRRSGPGLR